MKYLLVFVLSASMANYLSAMDCNAQKPVGPEQAHGYTSQNIINSAVYHQIKKQMPLYPYYKGSFFLLKHFVPLEIQQILDAQQDDRGTTFKNLSTQLGYQPVFNASFLPDYMLKFEPHTNIARIHYAKKLQKIINQEQLDLIKIPQKFFYCSHPHDRILLIYSPETKSYAATPKGMYVTVAKKINPAHQQHISNAHIDQLATLIQKSGIADLHENNMIIDQNGFLYIIDTEPRMYENFNQNPTGALITGLQAMKYWANNNGKKTIDNRHREQLIQQATKQLFEKIKKS